MKLGDKLAKLKRILGKYESCLIAFSGGQDSAFLLKVCATVLPLNKILAVTAVSATYPKSELAKARILAHDIGVRLKVIRTAELANKKFTDNCLKRCYYCKKELFTKLLDLAKINSLRFVLEASNLTDQADYRPGSRAKKELKIESPLLKSGFTKEDIRSLSKKLGLSSWNKPSLACLASRVPYGVKITQNLLKRIDQAEEYLHDLDFCQVRLRDYGDLCRIEVEEGQLFCLLNKRRAIIRKLKSLGYNYITLDLEGYRTGSLNEVIKR